MRIAQVAPLEESVPPKLYGGTERVVSYLTEELVRQGHEVVLYASGDSQTNAELRSTCPQSLRLAGESRDALALQVLMLEQVRREAHEFDIIHYHIDYLHFPLSRRSPTASITTLHGRLDLDELRPLYDEFRDMPVVSISDSQREPLPRAAWVSTVYHGLPPELYRFTPKPDGYVAFLGRFSPEKRVDLAVEIAGKLGLKLKIAAKIEKRDHGYFEREVAHLLEKPHVEYVGEIDEKGKSEFLGNARALLFPIDWCEPFGLVMIESMACGTPVIAFRRGSVGEVVNDGETGFVCHDVESAVRAYERVEALDRVHCREVFEERFSAQRMAEDYVRAYQQVIDARGERG